MAQSKEMISRARQLRRDMTKEERHLWYDFLRAYVPRFTRQKIVEPYILDFYCSAAGLAVELDGGQHYEDAGKAYDERRTAYLQQQGIQVLRFSNLDVMRNFDGVCRQIDIEAKKRLAEKSRQP
ncbi:endonuclease domain-containing protein [Gemmiger sp.]